MSKPIFFTRGNLGQVWGTLRGNLGSGSANWLRKKEGVELEVAHLYWRITELESKVELLLTEVNKLNGQKTKKETGKGSSEV